MRIAVALVAVALLSSCSGDDPHEVASEPNEYSEALRSAMDEQDQFFDDDQAECLSISVIDALGGPERFRDAGIGPDDLAAADGYSDLGFEATDDERAALARAFGGCDISLAEPLLAGMGIQDLSPEARDCVAEALDEDALAELFASSIVDSAVAEDRAAFLSVLQPAFECVETPAP